MRTVRLAFLPLAALCLLAAGCVEREMTITTEPEGATVTVNQTWTGQTPYRLPFKHYGTYDIIIQKEGFHPLRVAEPVAAPAYQQPGPDLVAEALVPATIRDERHLHYVLEPVGEADPLEDVIARGKAMREQTQHIAKLREEKDADRDPLDLPLPSKHEEEEDETPPAPQASGQ